MEGLSEDGRIVASGWAAEMVRPRSDSRSRRYGLGFWLDASNSTIMLEGSDAGVSFRTTRDPERDVTWTVMSNTSDGAWPVARRLRELLSTWGLRGEIGYGSG